MNKRILDKLEFDKIITMLSSQMVSSLAKEMASELKPQKDYDTINTLLKETSDGVDFILRRGTPPLSGIHDIRQIIKRVEIGAILAPIELLKVADVLRTSRVLKNYKNESRIPEESNVVAMLIDALFTAKKVEDKIKDSILNEEELMDDASPALSSIRRQIKSSQNSIKEKLNHIIHSAKYRKIIQDPIVTMRGDRYVIPIKQEFKGDFKGIVHDSSSSGSTIFIEPIEVLEINNSIKQLKAKEQAEIEKILQQLTDEVKEIIDILKSNIEILTKVDFIFGKANLSIKFNCNSPIINTNKNIVLKQARHPLIDPKVVVPLDFYLKEGIHTVIITGPNTGGKTVTLKTVGLLTLMAQSGLHIPVSTGTEVCIFNNIFCDIGDEQSIEQNLSTFSSHIKNIIDIIENTDSISLILLDELGAGTDPIEGAALAMSILERLYELGAIIIATTHYSELKQYALMTKGVLNACCEFDADTLKPTYKLLIGIPGKSNAFLISKKLGLSEKIISRAKEFITQEDMHFEDVLHSIDKNLSEAKQQKEEAQQLKQTFKNKTLELEQEKEKLNIKQEEIINEAKKKAAEILLSAKTEAFDIISEIKRLEKEREISNLNIPITQVAIDLKNKIDKNLNELKQPAKEKLPSHIAPKKVKSGEDVLIVSLNQKATVLSEKDKDGQVLVQVGIMKMYINISDLKLLNGENGENGEKQTKPNLVSSRSSKINKSMDVKMQLDLRGYYLQDAIEVLDKYIDDVSLSSLKEVTIIHGRGTGVLRTGIHSYLKTNSHIKGFRLGKFGEGEDGVTILELK